MRHVRKHLRIDRLGWAFAALVSVGLIGLIVYALASQQTTIDNLRVRNKAIAAQGTETQRQYQSLVQQYGELWKQAESSGTKPTTVDPDDVPKSVAGPTGPAGAVGSAGRDGRGVAFTLCTATGWAVTYTDGTTENAGTCVGATGKTGATGSAGRDGVSVNGTDGAAGPAGQTGPAGPAGPAGTPGTNGADGHDGADGTGVASISCVATDTGTAFRFTLTDGSTQNVPGACAPPTSPSPAG